MLQKFPDLSLLIVQLKVIGLFIIFFNEIFEKVSKKLDLFVILYFDKLKVLDEKVLNFVGWYCITCILAGSDDGQ